MFFLLVVTLLCWCFVSSPFDRWDNGSSEVLCGWSSWGKDGFKHCLLSPQCPQLSGIMEHNPHLTFLWATKTGHPSTRRLSWLWWPVQSQPHCPKRLKERNFLWRVTLAFLYRRLSELRSVQWPTMKRIHAPGWLSSPLVQSCRNGHLSRFVYYTPLAHKHDLLERFELEFIYY